MKGLRFLLLLLLLLAVLLPTRSWAQTSLLGDPANPQPGTLVYERSRFPAVLTRAQTVELLNAVAWANRATGWGMLAKSGDNSCSNGRISISCDTLIHYPSTMHFDVLIDGEATARPDWRPNGPCFLGPSSGCELSKFVAPYDPGTGPVPPPVVIPPSGPIYIPPATPPLDLSLFLTRADAERMFADLVNRDERQVRQTAALADQLRVHDEKVGALTAFFSNRIVQLLMTSAGTAAALVAAK